MDSCQLIVKHWDALNLQSEWSEARDVLQRIAIKEPRDWRLPVLACEAVGGDPDESTPAIAAIAFAQIAIILIDDMLDCDPRGEHHKIGLPAAANLAAAFQCAALNSLAGAELDPTIKTAAIDSLNQMLFITSLGQHLDTQNILDEAAYWHIVKNKSAPFFGTSLYLGALCGGASLEAAQLIKQFGQLYGEMIQIHDDLNDSLAVPANPDWKLGRASLPILFAQTVEHPQRERFWELRQVIADPEALIEAQTILLRSGAISYGIHHLLERHQQGRDLLRMMPLQHKESLESLLEEQVEPIRQLFLSINETKGVTE
jgi:geranylgeranyl pyrophosphate synthase